jgi:hypothetical protein
MRRSLWIGPKAGLCCQKCKEKFGGPINNPFSINGRRLKTAFVLTAMINDMDLFHHIAGMISVDGIVVSSTGN